MTVRLVWLSTRSPHPRTVLLEVLVSSPLLIQATDKGQSSNVTGFRDDHVLRGSIFQDLFYSVTPSTILLYVKAIGVFFKM